MDKQRHIIFFTWLLPTLNAKEALFMSFMINQLLLAETEWFLVTAEQIFTNTGLTQPQQVAIKKKLYELGLLETERRGTPPKNWYTINLCKLPEALQ